MSALGDPFQQGSIVHQARQRRGEVLLRIAGSMIEAQAGYPVRDEIVEAAQVRHDDRAAGGHGLEGGEPEGLAGFREARIREDGGGVILLDQGLLVEHRADEFALRAERLADRIVERLRLAARIR